ncbi:MAG: glycosyltransferase family 87 protein [Acidimicrobiales bacterium]
MPDHRCGTVPTNATPLTIRRLADRAWRRICAIPALRQDALLYAASGCWALVIWRVAISNDYREWGAWATVPYLLAAAGCELAFRHERRRPWESPRASRSFDPARAMAMLGLVVFTLFIPLAVQVARRADTYSGAQAQPEVAVVERAGDRLARFQDPYPRDPINQGKSPWTDNPQIDARSYFPYLPAMSVFGLASAIPGAGGLGDARVELAGIALLATLVALWLLKAAADRKIRLIQVLLLLPTGALPFVTGGDDLPVLAFMLLALVLAERRQPVWSGLAMGLASAMKLSAWALLALLFFAERDQLDRRAGVRYAAAALGVAVPVVLAGILAGPHAFIVSAVEYPLDLTNNRSPAKSPLPGRELLKHLPGSGLIELVLLGAVIVVLLVLVARHLPRDPSQAAVWTAVAMVAVTLGAPASRFGYLIYPLNLLVWAFVLRSCDTDVATEGVSASPVAA